MSKNMNGIRKECLSCGDTIIIKRPIRMGQIVTCLSCGDELEIVELNPILLDWPLAEEEYSYDREIYSSLD